MDAQTWMHRTALNVNDFFKRSIDQITATFQPTNQSTDQPTNQATFQSTNQLISQSSISQLISQLTNQYLDLRRTREKPNNAWMLWEIKQVHLGRNWLVPKPQPQPSVTTFLGSSIFLHEMAVKPRTYSFLIWFQFSPLELFHKPHRKDLHSQNLQGCTATHTLTWFRSHALWVLQHDYSSRGFRNLTCMCKSDARCILYFDLLHLQY